ncbi:O-methyltransferase [Streptomyces sp. NPDC002073]
MDDTPRTVPAALAAIDAAGFAMSCDPRTGSLLATLAATKPGGRIVELGTGVGAGAAWLLDGMDPTARLTTVELDSERQMTAIEHLSGDPRIRFHAAGADEWLDSYNGPPLDMVYVDCRPGKFERLEDLLDLLAPGGIYIGDDLLPQPTWPTDHQPRVDEFLERLPGIPNLRTTTLRWASGLVVGARI